MTARSVSLLLVLLLSSVFGCSTTVHMTHCESWTHRGSSDDNPDNNYMIQTTTELCGSKCGCVNDGRLIRCEAGWVSDCFRRCAQLWEVECGNWVKAPATVDFITGEEIKKGSAAASEK